MAELDSNKLSIEDIDKEISKLSNEIRSILNRQKSKDVREFSVDDKEKLRKKYEKIAKLAKKRSKWSKDEEDIEKFESIALKATKQAIHYGSNLSAHIPTETFDDVIGLDNVKKLVKSFVYMSQNLDIINYYHIEGGLGMLMYGCPGTGKTMFAKAVAHELNLPLYIITPDKIFKSHVGESEESVKKIFDAIDEEEDGCVIFVDECESIFSTRSEDTQDYKASVTTELLQRINGFSDKNSKNSSRIMIAATNRPDMIDKAYLRYKRFSHLVHITPPDKEARRTIIANKLKGIDLADITLDDIVEMMEKKTMVKDSNGNMVQAFYYSSANLCGIVEEACRIAIQELENEKSSTPKPLTRKMFEEAFEKIRPGITLKELKMYEDFEKGSRD